MSAKQARTAEKEVRVPEVESAYTLSASLDFNNILKRARDIFYRDDNVVGVGFGPRRVDDEVRREENALLVYVLQKLPESALDSEKLIPKDFMGVKTDVIEAFAHEGTETTVDYFTENYLNHDMTNIDWARLHELAMRTEAPGVEHPVTVQDFGDVTVVQNDGTVVKTDPQGNPYVDFVRAYQLFRTLHGDDYDHVTFFVDTASGMPSVCGCSFWSGIYNDVQGIGLGAFNSRPTWGTSRLQGFHFLNQGHFPIWRYVMLQEWGHQFGAFVRYRDPVTSATMTDHLLGDLAHWALELDDEKSPMDYDFNNWVELPGGQFRKVTITSDDRIYSNLDLYLMGLLGPNEVGEFTLLRNVVPVGGSTTDFTATPVRLNIQNFVAQEGSRIPTVASSPKYWRQAFVVLTNDIHRVHDLVDTVDGLRLRWERDFMEATKLLGRVDTVLDARPGRITPSQVLELTSGNYTTLHRHVVVPGDLQVAGTQWTATINPGEVQNWFTFGWNPAWFMVWSARPTTPGGKLKSEVEIERAGDGTFTYWIRVTNVGSVATSFEGRYARLK